VAGSKASTPEAYLEELPPERRDLAAHLRDLVNANLPPGYVERMAWGMISWELPMERYPNTYNGQPLTFAALAAQKGHTALYLNCIYASDERSQRLRDAYAAAGKKLDMGKSCLRFKRREDVADEVLAESIAAVPVDDFIAEYERTRTRTP
jgi:hypothetical protein